MNVIHFLQPRPKYARIGTRFRTSRTATYHIRMIEGSACRNECLREVRMGDMTMVLTGQGSSQRRITCRCCAIWRSRTATPPADNQARLRPILHMIGRTRELQSTSRPWALQASSFVPAVLPLQHRMADLWTTPSRRSSAQVGGLSCRAPDSTGNVSDARTRNM